MFVVIIFFTLSEAELLSTGLKNENQYDQYAYTDDAGTEDAYLS